MNLTHLLILVLQLISITNLSELSKSTEPNNYYDGVNLEEQSNYQKAR